MMKAQLPAEAQIDLSATVSGQFSAEDWQKILARAESELEVQMTKTADPVEAWQEVVRDFYSQRYWGYQPFSKAQLKKVNPPARKNLGIQFIWITFNAMCGTKVIVLWLGQTYARSEDNWDFFWLVLAIFLIVANFGIFLWQTRHHKD